MEEPIVLGDQLDAEETALRVLDSAPQEVSALAESEFHLPGAVAGDELAEVQRLGQIAQRALALAH